MMPATLRVEDLSVRYSGASGASGDSVHAVDAVSFCVAPGEVFAIVGESGCGKTAVLMALAGLLPAPGSVVGGSIVLDGRDLLALRKDELNAIRGRSIGVIFQEPRPALNPVMPVGRQVAEVIVRHQQVRGKALADRVAELFDLVGIANPRQRMRNYPHELSGGMAQRVVIAMAIACGPSLLLADEPTTALDVTIQAGILRVLKALRRDFAMTVVLVTHDLGVVAALADRVMVMYAGRKIEEAPVDALFRNPRHPYTAGILSAARRLGGATKERQSEIAGMVPTLRSPARNCSFAARCQRRSDECISKVPRVGTLSGGHSFACFHPIGEHSVDCDAARV